MTSFEYFSIALSFVLGLGVTRLLLGGVGVFRARRRQRVHWIPIVWAVSIFLFQIQYWWAGFELKELIETWTHGAFATLLSLAVLLFIAGALILPASANEERKTLFEYFEQDGRWALLALAAYAALAMWANWFLFQTSPISQFGAIVWIYGLTALAAFLVTNRRILQILTIGFLIIAMWAYLFFAPAAY
jgi:hypothetical protein